MQGGASYENYRLQLFIYSTVNQSDHSNRSIYRASEMVRSNKFSILCFSGAMGLLLMDHYINTLKQRPELVVSARVRVLSWGRDSYTHYSYDVTSENYLK
ncbi:hypothetical protein ACMFMF_005893 [Clarireedia jacksonii]